MRHFLHSGDLGDIIYSLPTVRALGGGTLWLAPDPRVRTMHGSTPESFASIVSLLKAQEYLADVRCEPPPAGVELVNLNEFRVNGSDLFFTNLADLYLSPHGLPKSHRNTPWLKIPRPAIGSRLAHAVVMSRSCRYHNPGFPWSEIVQRFGNARPEPVERACFIGTPEEHAAFTASFGGVPYEQTPTLLDVAEVIAAADLFVGNQSAPLAIAHGLGQSVLIEVCPHHPHCLFGRANEFTDFEKVLRTED
jgi:hypothetical protein